MSISIKTNTEDLSGSHEAARKTPLPGTVFGADPARKKKMSATASLFDESALQTVAREMGQEEDSAGPLLPDASLRSTQRIAVRPESIATLDAKAIFVQATLSKMPWKLFESVYRAFRILVAAALDVPRDAIKCSIGELIGDAYLCSEASYCLSPTDSEKLRTGEVQERVRVGLALLGDKHLWTGDGLEARFSGLPWQEMLPAARMARDEIKATNLPCDVGVELKGAPPTLYIGTELAPKRPPVQSTRTVTEVGHSHGYVHRRQHRLHFAKDDARDTVDIDYAEGDFLDQVIAVSGLIPPWIEVQYIEERHNDVVVSRILTSVKVRTDALFASEKKGAD